MQGGNPQGGQKQQKGGKGGINQFDSFNLGLESAAVVSITQSQNKTE
jgi:hypothetical protein